MLRTKPAARHHRFMSATTSAARVNRARFVIAIVRDGGFAGAHLADDSDLRQLHLPVARIEAIGREAAATVAALSAGARGGATCCP
jgi:hypothetical protein